VSRATIYRNWPDTADLVSALLEQETNQEPPGRLSSDPGEAITELTMELGRRLADPELAALLLAGADSARRSDHAAASTREFIAALLAPLTAAVVAALDSDLVVGEPTELLADLVGPLLGDKLIGRPTEAERAREVALRFLDSHLPDRGLGRAAASPEARPAVAVQSLQ
jgi:AcrR family transcriptional regulator